MKLQNILQGAYEIISSWSKKKLFKAFQVLRERYQELEQKICELKEENARLKRELAKIKIQEVNKKANQASSKQPEWEPKGAGNDGNGKKKGRGKKGRPGAGNKSKDVKPTKEVEASVESCDQCGRDLSKVDALESPNERIIEDIPALVTEPEIILVKQEKKYCDDCKKVTTARSELGLP